MSLAGEALLPAGERRRVTAGTARICLVGPMLGVNPGWVQTQGETLAGLLAGQGHRIRTTSHKPARLPRLLDTLASIFRWRNEVDLVIHQVFSGMAFGVTDAASVLCEILNLRQLFVLHGGALPQFASRHPRWAGRVLQRADAIVTPSAYLARVFGPLAKTPEDIRVIPNILAIEEYPFRLRSSLRPRLLWMRTFHDVYHPKLAIRVLAELRESHPGAMLTMAGQEKGLGARMDRLTGELGLGDHVHFPGYLGLEEKRREFDRHDIFLNTSRIDNMPVSVLEAGAFGLPVVATRVGGIPDLLEHERTGLLVPDGDVGAMAAAVRRLLVDPALARRLSAAGRALAEQSGWEMIMPQWEALIEEVINARSA